MRVRMRLTEVRCRRIWGNFAGISLLIAVSRPKAFMPRACKAWQENRRFSQSKNQFSGWEINNACANIFLSMLCIFKV